MSGFYHTLAVLTALLGSVLAVLAVALYEGYITASLVGGVTDTEMGTFAAIAIVVAIVSYLKDKQ